VHPYLKNQTSDMVTASGSGLDPNIHHKEFQDQRKKEPYQISKTFKRRWITETNQNVLGMCLKWIKSE
jgi:K+-transporting ATPase c subunit